MSGICALVFKISEYQLFLMSCIPAWLSVSLTVIYVLLPQCWDRWGPPGPLSRPSSQEHLLQVQRRADGTPHRGRLGQKERWTGELMHVLVLSWQCSGGDADWGSALQPGVCNTKGTLDQATICSRWVWQLVCLRVCGRRVSQGDVQGGSTAVCCQQWVYFYIVKEKYDVLAA